MGPRQRHSCPAPPSPATRSHSVFRLGDCTQAACVKCKARTKSGGSAGLCPRFKYPTLQTYSALRSSVEMSMALDASEGVAMADLRRELAAKGEELACALDRLKSADARIRELEVGASASPAPSVDDGDPFDAAACRARLVESGKKLPRRVSEDYLGRGRVNYSYG